MRGMQVDGAVKLVNGCAVIPGDEPITAVTQLKNRLYIFTATKTYRTVKIRRRWRDAHKIPRGEV